MTQRDTSTRRRLLEERAFAVAVAGGSAMQFHEHPDADVSIGMGFQERIISALRRSRVWHEFAFLLRHDEHGGSSEHRAGGSPHRRATERRASATCFDSFGFGGRDH